jgi:hypothetical protein
MNFADHLNQCIKDPVMEFIEKAHILFNFALGMFFILGLLEENDCLFAFFTSCIRKGVMGLFSRTKFITAADVFGVLSEHNTGLSEHERNVGKQIADHLHAKAPQHGAEAFPAGDKFYQYVADHLNQCIKDGTDPNTVDLGELLLQYVSMDSSDYQVFIVDE